ncbi:MAG: MDR family MFS transporter [Acidimicrobiia bacterium]
MSQTLGTELSPRAVRLAFTGLMTAMALAAIDATIVNTALPTIVGDLGGIRHYAWVGTAYLLANTIALPLFGKMSDLHGRRKLLMIAIIIFTIGSIACGVANTMTFLVIARGVQGIGGGGLMAMNFAIIADIVPPRDRGRYISYITALFAIGGIIGPLLGGFIVDNLSWRWIFLVNPPFAVFSLVMCMRTLRYATVKREAKVDLLGAALIVVAVGSIIVLASGGGTEFAWSSPTAFLLGGLGVLGLVAFVFQERRAVEPIISMALFRNRAFAAIVAASFVLGTVQMGSSAFLPLFLQAVKGVSATNSGILLLPQIMSLTFATIILGRVISKTGRYRSFTVGGVFLIFAGIVSLTRLSPDTSRFYVTIAMVLLGFGFGCTMPTMTIALQASVDSSNQGVASSASQFFRSMGGSIGLALFGAVLTSRLDLELARRLPGSTVDSSVIQAPKALRELPAESHRALVDSLSKAISHVYLIGIPSVVIGGIIVFLTREVKLDEHRVVDADNLEASLPAH